MGSDESHFNVSLIVKYKVTRRCWQTTAFEEKEEPKQIPAEAPLAYQPNDLPLGQTGWRWRNQEVQSLEEVYRKARLGVHLTDFGLRAQPWASYL